MQNSKYLAAALAVCLTLSGCANRETQETASVSSTGGEQASSALSSSQSQQTSSQEQTSSQSQQEQLQSQDLSAQESDDKNLLSLEEIKTVFSDLDAQANEMLDWVQKDYSQIPIAGIPVHKVDNAVVNMKWVSMNAENPDAGGFKPIYGTAVFAKVTEETLPGFPWENGEEIHTAITNIYESQSESGGLEYLVESDLDNQFGIFYQFDDGLYFRANYTGLNTGGKGYTGTNNGWKAYWDYASIQILQNEPDEVQVEMYLMNADRTKKPQRRGLVKNEYGNWVLTGIIYQ